MTNLHRSSPRSNAATAGLILSLASELPSQQSPLARRARAVASHGTIDDAAQCLADLLDATDCGIGLAADGLLDDDFDGFN